MRPRRALEPPPELTTAGLPAPVEDLWPLAHAPIAVPQLGIADAFGVTGPWADLCERRPDPVRKADRDAVLDYLYAWCTAGTGSVTRAGAALAKLESSARVVDAAHDDLPVVLGFASAQVALGQSSAFDLDKLAAGYLAFDHFDDAAAVMRAIDLLSGPPEARCHRLVRAYLLGTADRAQLAAQIRASSDPACAAGVAMFACPVAYGIWVPPPPSLDLAQCAPLVDAHPWLAARLHLARVYVRWREPLDAHGWLRFALEETSQPFALPGVEEAALRALENAAISADCARDLADIQRAVAALPAQADHDRELDARIVALRRLDAASCRGRQRIH